MPISLLHVGLPDFAASALRQWWNNPLLRHARHRKPLPRQPFRSALVIVAGALALLTVLAWIAQWRWVGAVLMGLSTALVLLPMLVAAVVSANRVSRQMRFSRQDPRHLTDLDPGEVTWGLALVTLWQIRWLIGPALALTPALVLGLLRLDISRFQAMQAAMVMLGSHAELPVGTLPGERVPYMRLIMRALSAGLLPWAILPLTASLGVTASLYFRGDTPLSSLASLVGNLLVGALIGAVWSFVAQTLLLVGLLEAVRLVLLVGLLIGLGMLTAWINRQNAWLLLREQSSDRAIE